MLKACCVLLCFFCLIGQAYGAEVVIDPGHSPARPGAQSCTGKMEYVYNDALAARVSASLDKAGVPNILSRQPGQDISLTQRGKLARGRDFLLSVHHDAVQPQFVKKINGLPHSDKARGFSLFVSRKNPFFEESLRYAREIGRELVKTGLRPSTHHGEKIKGENRTLLDDRYGIYEFNDLIVLKGSSSPAVLFEAGVIVNPEDEKLVSRPDVQAKIAGAISRGIVTATRKR